MLAIVSPLHISLTTGVGSKGLFSFLKVATLHVKVTEMKQRTHCKQKLYRLINPTIPKLCQKSQNSFFLKSVVLHIKLKGKKCIQLCKFDLVNTSDPLGWVKGSDIEIVQMCMF